ncbi:MAG: hypothetical protein WCA07_06015 [Gloeobacterales cyanobacterium]
MVLPVLPKLKSLPAYGAVEIKLEEGIPIFRASEAVQARIEILLAKQKESPLSVEEEQELDSGEEIDDYLSFVNHTMHNVYQRQQGG